MKTLKTILNTATIALLSFGLISFFTNNLTDAIFAVVVAILIRQEVVALDKGTA